MAIGDTLRLGLFTPSLGPLPPWSSGVTPAGDSTGAGSPSPIFGSDLVDRRSWLNCHESAAGKATSAWTNGAGVVTVVNRPVDARGLLASESVPHRVGLTVPGQFVASDWAAANPATTRTYDALRRPATRTQPDGTSVFQWLYAGWATTLVDENGHQRGRTDDALGRLATVQEYTGHYPHATLLNTTPYADDVANQLLTVTDASGATLTSVTYDSAGRRTALSDLNRGSWGFASNPIGTLASQTDAKDQTISFTYDLLDRILSTAGPNLAVTYGYDAGANAAGRRSSLGDGVGTASYGYDQRGRLTAVTRSIAGAPAPYQRGTTYDEQDRVLTLSYPNSDLLSYHYGDHGQPVDLVLNNGTYLVRGAGYNALGQANALPLGNGLTTQIAYFGLAFPLFNDPTFRHGRRYQIQTGSLQNLLFAVYDQFGNLVWTYDGAGNPQGLTFVDHTGEQVILAYNELAQLTSFQGHQTDSYASLQNAPGPPYNTWDGGNLLEQGGVAITYPDPGYPQPDAPTAAGPTTYTYDANGNRASDSTGTSYSYDAENHLTEVQLSGQTLLQSSYDGDGRRLVRAGGGITTHYPTDWYEADPNALTAQAYYPFNGIPVAMRTSSGEIVYRHHDHRGSLVRASDTTGAEIGWAGYWPFGGIRQQSSSFPTDRRFTGQIRDLGNDGFYFFRARHYDAGVARFFQPDPATPSWKNSLTINPYAYALNNPLRYADPSGHRTEAQIEGYLQQLYGKEWQQSLASWRANANWWGALTAVQPGDFLVAGRQIEQFLSGGVTSTCMAGASSSRRWRPGPAAPSIWCCTRWADRRRGWPPGA